MSILKLISLSGILALCGVAWLFSRNRKNINWSLQALMGYIFYPLVAMLGIAPQDISTASTIIGERIVMTELVSYQHLASVIGSIEPRSAVIITYALCGFAHLASLAIFVGGTAALAPSRAKDISSVGIRALIAANLACLCTACVVGLFPLSGSILLGNRP